MEPLALWRIWTQVAIVATAVVLCTVRSLPSLRIVCSCIVLMVGYGILQDQFSVRLCPEYFTVGHPPIVELTDPTLLGIAWGFLGAWWGGLFFGLALATTMRVGSRPPMAFVQLTWPLTFLFLGVAGVTVLFGVGTYLNADVLGVSLGEPWASQIPPERHQAMLVVANAHVGSYGSAIAGGFIVCLWVVWKRRQMSGLRVSS